MNKTVLMRKSTWLSGLIAVGALVVVAVFLSEGFYSVRVPLERIRTLLAGSEFLSNAQGDAFPEYAAAASLLLENAWSRERFKEARVEGAEHPSASELRVLKEAARLVIRGAKKRTGGMPHIDYLQTTLRFNSEEFDLVEFTLAADAALLVARSQLQRADFNGAVRTSQAALAMGLHFMTSDDAILAFGGVKSCKHAIEELQRIAGKTGDAKAEEACSAALVVLDEEFQALKATHSGGPSILEILGFLWK